MLHDDEGLVTCVCDIYSVVPEWDSPLMSVILYVKGENINELIKTERLDGNLEVWNIPSE